MNRGSWSYIHAPSPPDSFVDAEIMLRLNETHERSTYLLKNTGGQIDRVFSFNSVSAGLVVVGKIYTVLSGVMTLKLTAASGDPVTVYVKDLVSEELATHTVSGSAGEIRNLELNLVADRDYILLLVYPSQSLSISMSYTGIFFSKSSPYTPIPTNISLPSLTPGTITYTASGSETHKVTNTYFERVNTFIFDGTATGYMVDKVSFYSCIYSSINDGDLSYDVRIMDITNNIIMGSNTYSNEIYSPFTLLMSNAPAHSAVLELQVKKGTFGDSVSIGAIQWGIHNE